MRPDEWCGEQGFISLIFEEPLPRENVYHMIQRRAKDAGIETALGCHTFRATGITVYLQNGGTLEKAQIMTAHESARTTKLYDEVERIVF